MTQFHLPNAQATHEFGKQFGRSLPPNSVLLLEGNLGAGKTTFVQGLAEGLDLCESIESPTFTLINEYLNGRIPLYHLDLYRLETSEIEDLN
ncbi:MAG: tRNA (adenosine(37)-N6)-threonylcarbamoyltransferase complex ATPase subunit type 1 TsaE, partial [Planktothrix sp.]